jgi:two-component system CheB/CheR fusion protein
VAVDAEGVVRLWNAHSEDLWGVYEGEALGTHLLALDIGLPLEPLRVPLRRTLTGDGEVGELELEATNRRGRPVRVRVAYRPLTGTAETPAGAILLVEEVDGAGRDGDGANPARAG